MVKSKLSILNDFGYEYRDRIGAGGFAEVLLCWNEAIGFVAVKSLLEKCINDETPRKTRTGNRKSSDISKELFMREYRILNKLDNCSSAPKLKGQKIIMTDSNGNHLREANNLDDVKNMFIIMEYVRGPTIEHITNSLYNNSIRLDNEVDNNLREIGGKNRTFIPLYPAKYIAEFLASGLEEVHNNGIIHQDLTPPNIMIKWDESIRYTKIIDFGIAEEEEDKENRGLKIDINVGNRFYTSPEQIIGEEITYKSDIHQFGQVLYQLLTNVNPFINQDVVERKRNIIKKLIEHLKENQGYLTELQKNIILSKVKEDALKIRYDNVLDGHYISPRKINKEIPRELSNIIEGCLEVDPNKRYHSMKDVVNDLEKLHVYGRNSEVLTLLNKVYSKFPAKLRK